MTNQVNPVSEAYKYGAICSDEFGLVTQGYVVSQEASAVSAEVMTTITIFVLGTGGSKLVDLTQAHKELQQKVARSR